ncbi:MAG: diacylglycerol/lipid kinase family protein [Longimicrobiales bacterium]
MSVAPKSSIVRAAGPYAGRICIIVNPAAGQEETARLRRKLGGAFAARGAAFDLVTTEYAGHATIIACEAAQLGYQSVCVVGGDGTLAEAATGVAGTSVPLAIIPRGTANQVARNLSIPVAFERAVEVAVHGTPTAIDLGRVNGRSFALLAGAGFDAAVMTSATRELKERWGFAAYIFAAVKEVLAVEPARFSIRADQRELEVSAVTVMIANVGELFTRYLPLRLPLTPHPFSSWNDGLFDVVIIAPRKFPHWATVLWNAARHRFGGTDELIHLQAREVTIDAEPVVPVQIDGDPAGTTPMTAVAIERAARILLPRGP